jgi:hypothetical protein
MNYTDEELQKALVKKLLPQIIGKALISLLLVVGGIVLVAWKGNLFLALGLFMVVLGNNLGRK